MEEYISGKGFKQPDKLPEKNQIPRFNEEEMSVVQEFIDPHLVGHFGYNLNQS
jgi:hypothetical protein